jgi:hypothetical protein
MQGNSTLIKKLLYFLQEIRNRIRREPIPFVALLLTAGGFFAFSKLASEVVEGESFKIDTLILLMMRNASNSNYPLGPPWLEEMMRDFTGLGGVGVLTIVTLSSAIYLFIIIKKRSYAVFDRSGRNWNYIQQLIKVWVWEAATGSFPPWIYHRYGKLPQRSFAGGGDCIPYHWSIAG